MCFEHSAIARVNLRPPHLAVVIHQICSPIPPAPIFARISKRRQFALLRKPDTLHHLSEARIGAQVVESYINLQSRCNQIMFID